MFGSHFNKLRDLDHDRVRYLSEVGRVSRVIPPEIVRIVNKILHHEIFRITERVSGFRDLIERRSPKSPRKHKTSAASGYRSHRESKMPFSLFQPK